MRPPHLARSHVSCSCLLDVLAELIPAEQIIDSPCWSDSEDDDGLFDDGEEIFPDADFGTDSVDSEAEDLERLQAEYDELVRDNQRAKRFAPSPTRERIPQPKTRRLYKHLPVKDSGEVEFPVVLGRGPNRISISSIGPVTTGVDETGETVAIPLAYECRRKFADSAQADDADPKRQTYYSCSVSSLNGAPHYTIQVKDAPGDALVISSASLPGLWAEFTAKFPASIQAQLADDFRGPRSFFGLEHDNLVKYFKEQLEQ